MIQFPQDRVQRARALGANVCNLTTGDITEGPFPLQPMGTVHEIAGRNVDLAHLDKETLTLLYQQCMLRRDEAVLEAAIVQDYLHGVELQGGDEDGAS